MAAIALPAYQTYTKKARFSEVVLAASSVKGAIDTCYQTRGEGNLANCDTFAEIGGTEANATAGSEVAGIAITANTATITATGADTVDSATYILTPTPSNNSLIWSDASSSCISAGLC